MLKEGCNRCLAFRKLMAYDLSVECISCHVLSVQSAALISEAKLRANIL